MIRQKTTYCGEGRTPRYKEADFYIYSDKYKNRRKKKGKTRKEQRSLNFRMAKRHLNQLVKANFYTGDYRVDLTYDNQYLPKSIEEADKRVKNFILKINRELKKRGKNPLKYIWIDEGVNGGRIHHHLLISAGLERELIEDMWSTGQGKNKRPIGTCNVDRLRFNAKGLEGIVNYVTKQMKGTKEEGQLSFNCIEEGTVLSLDDLLIDDTDGKKRWKQSKNLTMPWETTRDNAMSRRELEKIVTRPEDCEDNRNAIEKRFPGYRMDSLRKEFNQITGTWSVYVTMHRIDLERTWRENG